MRMRRNTEAAETIAVGTPGLGVSPVIQFGLLERSDPSLTVSQITPSSSKNTAASSLSPGTGSINQQYKFNNATGEDAVVEYGFVPKAIINSMKDKDWKIRLDGVEKFFELVTRLPSAPPAVLPHMPNLIRFLSKLLFDPNFTICLTSIRLIGEILPKLQHHIKPTLSFFLPSLVEKFGDSKIIIRQETMKVVTNIMQIVSPSNVIEVMKACYDEKSPNVQQHILIAIIKAFLAFKSHQFDYYRIVPMLLSSLNSSKPKVKQASTEALAIANQVLSESQATSTLLESMLLSQCDPETIKMLHRRFVRGQLPILGPDGSVEFRIGPDGSVAAEFFDPSISNTPAPSPAPSRMHTPLASPSMAYADDIGGPFDARPSRNWSAGSTKAANATKHAPPWFPINSLAPSSPSSPGSPMPSSSPSPSPTFPSTPTNDDSYSTDIRRSVFQRTRSFSLSDKVNISNDDGPIFNMRNNQPFATLNAGASNNSSQANFYYNNSTNPLNLPPISTGLGSSIQRVPSTLGTLAEHSTLYSLTAGIDSDVRRRNRPPSPTLGTPIQQYSNLRDTGYSPSFGKKGSGSAPYPPAPTVYPPFPDFDLPLSNEPILPLNLSNNHHNFNAMNMYTPTSGTSAVGKSSNNSLTVMTHFDNHELDPALQQQQHRARIWSTLKPSTLATFPMGSQSDPPKRRFSGRNRRDSFEGGLFVDNTNSSNSNYGILENVEDDFELNATVVSTTKTDRPKQQDTSPIQKDLSLDDSQSLQRLKSNPIPPATPNAQDPPRVSSVLSSTKSPKPPRSGHSRHLQKERDVDSSPPTPTASASGPRQVNTSPSDIIPSEKLLPFDAPELELKQVMEWFANGEWYHQFEALASARILAAYHQRVIIPQIHPLLTSVLAATNNLRSLVSRHALVCIGDLFKHVGKHIEPHLDEIMLKILKKYNESNNFLEKELDRAMGLMLLNVSEARAVGVLLMSASNKSAQVRHKVAFFLANLVDILGSRVWSMREADRVLGVVMQFIQESSAETRGQGRRSLFLMHQSDSEEFERVLKRQCNESQLRKCHEVLEKIISSGDPVSLGAKKPSSAKPSRTPKAGYAPPSSIVQDEEVLSHKSTMRSPSPTREKPISASRGSPIKEVQVSPERRETPLRGRDSPMREMSKGSPSSISSTAAPELDSILSDLDSQEWRTRYTAIVSLVEFSSKDGKVQVLLAARIVKIFDHYAPCLQDPNAKVNMFALSSLRQIMPMFKNGMESVLGVLVPALIANLAASKQEVRTATQELFDTLLACSPDSAVLIPHLSCGVSNHANPKVKVILLQLLADLVGSVYPTKPSLVVKHVLPLAFKLLDEKKGELRTVNTRLMQSLFKAMGNALWESSNSFNLSKQEQTRLHEILTS